MPTNSRIEYVCVSATLENSSGILGWFLRFMGFTSNRVKKKIKERERDREKSRGECIEWQKE
jgi:hypothetical protein